MLCAIVTSSWLKLAWKWESLALPATRKSVSILVSNCASACILMFITWMVSLLLNSESLQLVKNLSKLLLKLKKNVSLRQRQRAKNKRKMLRRSHRKTRKRLKRLNKSKKTKKLLLFLANVTILQRIKLLNLRIETKDKRIIRKQLKLKKINLLLKL
jgi:hypothetical protein